MAARHLPVPRRAPIQRGGPRHRAVAAAAPGRLQLRLATGGDCLRRAAALQRRVPHERTPRPVAGAFRPLGRRERGVQRPRDARGGRGSDRSAECGGGGSGSERRAAGAAAGARVGVGGVCGDSQLRPTTWLIQPTVVLRVSKPNRAILAHARKCRRQRESFAKSNPFPVNLIYFSTGSPRASFFFAPRGALLFAALLPAGWVAR